MNPLVCNVCRGELAVRYPEVKDPITNEVFSIYKCVQCGVGHTVSHPENISKYYDGVYYGNRHGFTNAYCIRRRVNLVNSIRRPDDVCRLLDIGCGDGSFLSEMKKNGWGVAGVEINPNVKSGEDFVIKSAIEEFVNEPLFDCVVMWHVFEHMGDVNVALKKINQVLKPGGMLIVAVPNNESIQARIFKGKWLPLDVPRHLYHFDKSSLAYCLEKAGFNVADYKYQELEYDLMGWVQSGLNTMFSSQNIFLDYVTGKNAGQGWFINALNLALGSFFTLLSLPAVLVERLFQRSGTIIVAAKKKG